jgi:hypothetical protein
MIVNNEAVTELTEIVNTTINNTLNILTEDVIGLLDEGVIALHLDDTLVSSAGLNLDLSLSDTLSGGLDISALTGGAEDLVLGTTGLDLPLLSDAQASIGFDLLGSGAETDNAQGDTDITLDGLDHLGLDVPDIGLDPVESLAGDIDIAVDIPEELTDPGALFEDVQDVISDLDTLDLGGLEDIPDLLGGEGSEGDLDLEILDTDIEQNLDMTLDDLTAGALDDLPGNLLEDAGNVVEDLTDNLVDNLAGDPTDDLADALDLLNGGGEDGNDSGSLDDSIWTDISDTVDGLFDDIVSNDLGGADTLPDPIGGVAEGLGGLDIPLDYDGGGFGGLFG